MFENFISNFKSAFWASYYPNTYLPPVDLSDEALKKVTISASQVPDVMGYINNQLTLQEKEALNEGLTVSCRDQYKCYEILPTLVPTQEEYKNPSDKNSLRKKENLLSIAMAQHVNSVVKNLQQENKLPFKVNLPESKLVDATQDGVSRYFVVHTFSETDETDEIEINDVDEKADEIEIKETEKEVQPDVEAQQEEQAKIAQTIATIVEKTGIFSLERAHLDGQRQLIFLPICPKGLMVEKKSGLWNRFFGPQSESVEKYGRMGLENLFHNRYGTENQKEIFQKEILKVYSSLPLSKWKIALSVASLGLIVLVNVIVALAKALFIEINLRTMRQEEQKIDDIFKISPEQKKQLIKEASEARVVARVIGKLSEKKKGQLIDKVLGAQNLSEEDQKLLQIQKLDLLCDFAKELFGFAKELFGEDSSSLTLFLESLQKNRKQLAPDNDEKISADEEEQREKQITDWAEEYLKSKMTKPNSINERIQEELEKKLEMLDFSVLKIVKAKLSEVLSLQEVIRIQKEMLIEKFKRLLPIDEIDTIYIERIGGQSTKERMAANLGLQRKKHPTLKEMVEALIESADLSDLKLYENEERAFYHTLEPLYNPDSTRNRYITQLKIIKPLKDSFEQYQKLLESNESQELMKMQEELLIEITRRPRELKVGYYIFEDPIFEKEVNRRSREHKGDLDRINIKIREIGFEIFKLLH